MTGIERNDLRLDLARGTRSMQRLAAVLSRSNIAQLHTSARGTVVLSQLRIPNISLSRVVGPAGSGVWRRHSERSRRRRLFLLVKNGFVDVACEGRSGTVRPGTISVIHHGSTDVHLAFKGPETELMVLAAGNALGDLSFEGATTQPPVSTARSCLDLWHRDPDVNVETLAGKLGVSPRTLQKWFSREGSNVGTELRARRARTASKSPALSGQFTRLAQVWSRSVEIAHAKELISENQAKGPQSDVTAP